MISDRLPMLTSFVLAIVFLLSSGYVLTIAIHSLYGAIVLGIVYAFGLIGWVLESFKPTGWIVKYIQMRSKISATSKSNLISRVRQMVGLMRLSHFHFYTAPARVFRSKSSIAIFLGRAGRVFVAVFGIPSTITGIVIWLLSPMVIVPPNIVFVLYSVLSIFTLAFISKTLITYWSLEDYGVRQYDEMDYVLFKPVTPRVNAITSLGLLFSIFSLSASHIFVTVDIIGNFVLIGPYCVLAVLSFHFCFEKKILEQLKSNKEFTKCLEGELPKELSIELKEKS